MCFDTNTFVVKNNLAGLLEAKPFQTLKLLCDNLILIRLNFSNSWLSSSFDRIRRSEWERKGCGCMKDVKIQFPWICSPCVNTSATRLGDLLDFAQLFKTFGNNYFAQISHILRQFL